MKKLSKRLVLVNGIASAGYILSVVSWLLFLSVLFLFFTQDSSVILPASTSQANSSSGGVSQIVTWVAYLVAVIMGLISLAVVVTLPYVIGKLGAKWIRWSVRIFKIEESKRNLFFAKCSVAVLPLLGLVIMTFTIEPATLTIPTIHLAAAIISSIAILCFFLQLLLARWFRVATEKMW